MIHMKALKGISYQIFTIIHLKHIIEITQLFTRDLKCPYLSSRMDTMFLNEAEFVEIDKVFSK